MRKFLNILDQAPMFWVAISLGFFVFGVNRVLPGIEWHAATSEQSVLDHSFMHSLLTQQWQYTAIPEIPQTFGAHVLPQYLTAALSLVTGDTVRAGMWLSLVGITLTLCGLYPLAQRILPLRGFSVITLATAGALGAMQFSYSPDPSAALGMACVVWGMVFFLTSLTKHKPHDVFMSGFLFGLAGYIRIELSMMWVFLALYLICLALFQPKKYKHGMSYVSMAIGGLVMVLLVLWPLLHRNLQLSGSPILPGFDSEMVLGAPSLSGQAPPTAFIARIFQGVSLLLFSHRGPGIFAGLLWPLGILICLFMGRHKQIPYFWLPVVLGMLVCLSALSYVTGLQSFRECLLILTPLLFPFAVLPVAYAIHTWMQSDYHNENKCRQLWMLCGLGLFVLIQFPHFFRKGTAGNVEQESKRTVLISEFGTIAPHIADRMLLSDMPGSFLTAGKSNVIGVHGETDWQILGAKYANGDFEPEKLLAYMQEREVGMIHLSQVDDPLIDLLTASEGAPQFTPINRFSPPHRVFRVDWL
ncbi:hypothetical protein P3T73_03890 [Kiritimatiellota bacterium B12222]|nr:hypothetical protein P3T73_03890 [Kiritimatiellota bacterium B12222]